MQNTIRFTDLVRAAQFTAQLVREGVTFRATDDGESVVITLTGGF